VDVRLVADSSGDVRGHLVVSSDAARQLIETQLPDLQQRLTAAGISIQNFSVSADSSGSAGQQPRQEASPNPYNASYGQGTQSANRATAATAATSTLASEHVDVFA
jgi:flagellar hook-length control protein FliK